MLLSDNIAIVPVGNSCLTGFQLKRAKNLIEHLFNEKFNHTSSYFQWIFQDSRTTNKVFIEYVKNKNKISYEDISIDPLGQRWPYIKNTGSYFCHDGLDGDGEKRHPENISEREKITNVSEKYSYLIDKMHSLNEMNIRIFIFSNADIGFKKLHLYQDGHINWQYTDKDIKSITDSIKDCFPCGENKFVFVLNEHNEPINYKMENLSIFRVRDVDDFYKDNVSWDKIFNSIVGKCTNLTLFEESEYIVDISPGSNYNFLNENFVIDDNNVFQINYDTSKNKEINSAFIWGPYVRLTSGFYEAKLTFSRDRIIGSSLFKITSNFGEKTKLQSIIDNNIIDNIKYVRFNVEYEDSNVEACIYPNGSFFGSIKRITIKRITN